MKWPKPDAAVMHRLALPILLVLAPLAQAGTMDAPEIADPAGDANAPVTPTQGADEALDLIAVWVTLEPLTVHFAAPSTVASGPTDRMEYGVDVSVDGAAFSARVWRQESERDTAGGAWKEGGGNPCGHSHGAGGASQVALDIDDQAGTISFEIADACHGHDAFSVVRLSDAYTRHCHMEPNNRPIRCQSVDDAPGPGVLRIEANGTVTVNAPTAPPAAAEPENTTAPVQDSPVWTPLLIAALLWLARRQ